MIIPAIFVLDKEMELLGAQGSRSSISLCKMNSLNLTNYIYTRLTTSESAWITAKLRVEYNMKNQTDKTFQPY